MDAGQISEHMTARGNRLVWIAIASVTSVPTPQTGAPLAGASNRCSVASTMRTIGRRCPSDLVFCGAQGRRDVRWQARRQDQRSCEPHVVGNVIGPSEWRLLHSGAHRVRARTCIRDGSYRSPSSLFGPVASIGVIITPCERLSAKWPRSSHRRVARARASSQPAHGVARSVAPTVFASVSVGTSTLRGMSRGTARTPLFRAVSVPAP